MAKKRSAARPTKKIKIIEKGVEREVPMEGPLPAPVIKIPEVVEPYVQAVPVQARDVHTADPLIRTQALSAKVHLVTAFLAILTGCLMVIMQWFPKDWPELFIFLLWLGLASIEWIAVFVFLAFLDYKETPSAINWFLAKNVIGMMKEEQQHRLRAMYPNQFLEEDE